MGEEQFGLDAVGQILVPVSDVERSTAFYRDVLGMRFLFAYPGLAFFDCGEFGSTLPDRTSQALPE